MAAALCLRHAAAVVRHGGAARLLSSGRLGGNDARRGHGERKRHCKHDRDGSRVSNREGSHGYSAATIQEAIQLDSGSERP